MNRKFLLPVLAGLPVFCVPFISAQMEEPMVSAVSFADSQMQALLAGLGYGTIGVNPNWALAPAVYPKVTTSDSGEVEWSFTSANQGGSWGSGFTPGIMWDLYSLTGDSYWLEKADAWTTGMESTQFAGGDNRMNIGFFMMNSYARRIAYGAQPGDEMVMATAADTLLLSWMPTVGSLYSFTWKRGFRYDGLQGGWSDYENTIVDSAPNIEVLFHQAKQETDADMWDKALSHFSNLIRDNIRPDGSTIQLIAYDMVSGLPEEPNAGARGHQGYSWASTWSRGQGWAMHGFASAWRETRDPAMGDAFHQLYSYYRDNCPPDGVPYWDFEAPNLTDEQLEFRYPEAGAPALRYAKDSSAAALAASALMLASRLAETEALQFEYYNYGLHILKTLSTPGYLAADGSYNPTKDSILGQGAYTFPGTEKGQIWGDFFFVEALRRYRDLVEPATLFDTEPGWGDFLSYSVLSPQLWAVVPDLGDAALRLQGRESISDGLPSDLAIYRHAILDDFDLSFQFRADELLVPGNPVDVVFVCGYTDEGNYVLLRVSTDSARSGIFKVVGGTATLIASLDPVDATQGYHTLTVAVTGNQMQVAIDGSVQVPLSDPAVGTAGFVGIGGTGSSLFFDSVNVVGTETLAELSPRESWRETHFANPRSMLARDSADPDLDGRANLLEYAFGTNPLIPGGNNPGPSIVLTGPGSVEVSFPYNSSYSDVRYSVMESLDGGASWGAVHSVDPAGTDAWLNETYTLPTVGSQAAFYRIEVNPRH